VVNVGDLVRVRHTSSASPLTPTNQTLTIDGEQDTFTSTTESGGAFDANINIVASRTSGVSPMSVVFQAYTSTDPVNTRDQSEVFRELGYYWDFDDPFTRPNQGATSATYSLTTRNESKDTIIGGPIVAHTFEVAEGGGSQVFNVRVRVKTPEGEEYLQEIPITCQAQDSYFSGANTIAVSNTLNTADDWSLTSYDRNVPSTATRVATLGAVNWDTAGGKRILLKRGDDFSGEGGIIRLLMGQSNVMISWFGNLADSRPETSTIYLGVKSSGGTFFDVSQAQVNALGWGSNVTLDGIRLPGIENCTAPLDFGWHDCDLDYNAQSSGGGATLVNRGDVPWANGITGVPFPRGIYVSECTFIGSEVGAQSSSPLLNISGLQSACPTYLGIFGCYCRRAGEHNIRVQGAKIYCIQDCDIMGEHVGGQGGKHNITMRGQGYNQVGDFSDLERLSGSMGDALSEFDSDKVPSTGLGVMQRLTLSSGNVGQASTNISTYPTNANNLELIEDVLHQDIEIQDSTVQDISDIRLGGRRMTVTSITYHTGGITRTYNPEVEPLSNLTNNEVVNGVIVGTTANMVGGPTRGSIGNSDNRIDQNGQTDDVLPIPTAPR